MLNFFDAKWIWATSDPQNDSYVDFADSFIYNGSSKVRLVLSVDTDYVAYINGRMVGFGQYADYPTDKVGDSFDVTPYLAVGENKLFITAYYAGKDTQTYIRGKAGLIFAVVEEEKPLCVSSVATLCRPSALYRAGEEKYISYQLGFTYHADLTAEEKEFAPSVAVAGEPETVRPRPIKNLQIGERTYGEILQQGRFSYHDPNADLQKKMQEASFSLLPISDLTGSADRRMRDGLSFTLPNGEKGLYFILDLGKENVGFLDLDIETDEACTLDVGYGEHLTDGRCRTGIRNFTAQIELKKGRNVFTGLFRRFGCRYLEFCLHTSTVRIHYVGLLPVFYPLNAKKYQSGNLLRDTIYEVCEHTLACCMHVHYEDCPWREQALYVMDSRNQMLCGYYAFGETSFPRASLRLMANGLRPDGLLTLCYPAGVDFPIPSFSAAYFIAVREYSDYTKDISLAEEVFDVLNTVYETFKSRMMPNGVISNFYDEEGSFWNFYEWMPTMEGYFHTTEKRTEAPINAFYSLAIQNFAAICRSLGKNDKADSLEKEAQNLNAAIAAVFYNEKDKLFSSFVETNAGEYSVLTNSLCLLCGAADKVDQSVMLKVLASNGADNDGLTVYANTLSMNCFRFDALLRTDFNRYRDAVLHEIDASYLAMLRQGATTFWETALGDRDFDDAGSLCHGWSALPIYYYERLDQKNDNPLQL